MFILLKTIPEKGREFKTYENKLHHCMEAGAPPLSIHYNKLYSAGLQPILAHCS